MKVTMSEEIPDVLSIKFDKHHDIRGSFSRKFCIRSMQDVGLDFYPKQISHSHNNKADTLRGLHFQSPPYDEEKLVSCISGCMFDVVVDIRPASRTFGVWASFFLTADENTQLFIPKGFAHGFQTLSDNTVVSYMISENYNKGHASGIVWSDETLRIGWPKPNHKRIISERDDSFSTFDELDFN